MTTSIETLDTKYITLSENYKLAKTSEIIKTFENMGFIMDNFVALKTRNKAKHGYQKHRVIFSNPNLKRTIDGKPQILLTNSHDGTSSVVIQLGFFRMVCANGLVIGNDIVEPIKVRHIGHDFNERLIAAIHEIVNKVQSLIDSIEKMKNKQLTQEQIKAFQETVIKLRLGDDGFKNVVSVNFPIQRKEDTSSDVFTVMNVIQEGMIRGGADITYKEGDKERIKRIRKLTSIHSTTEMNTSLWSLAERLAA